MLEGTYDKNFNQAAKQGSAGVAPFYGGAALLLLACWPKRPQ